jgi:hypothetical protein
MDEYDGRQFVGIDLHRRRSVIVRQSESGEQLSAVRIVNDPVALGLQLEQAGPDPEVVLDCSTADPRIAGVGALPRQAGRDPIGTQGADPRRTGQGALHTCARGPV